MALTVRVSAWEMALLLLEPEEQCQEQSGNNPQAVSLGCSLPLSLVLHSERSGLCLAVVLSLLLQSHRAWVACLLITPCVEALSSLCLCPCIASHSPPRLIFAPCSNPLPFTCLYCFPVSPCHIFPFVEVSPHPCCPPGSNYIAHISLPSSALWGPVLPDPAQQPCLHPLARLLFLIVSQIWCQNPIAERLLGPLQPGRQQFTVIGLHAEGMFHADAYYRLLLIAVLFLLIIHSFLLWVMLERVHALSQNPGWWKRSLPSFSVSSGKSRFSVGGVTSAVQLCAGWLVSVACRFFTLTSNVPMSHVHVVCFQDDSVPVSSYYIGSLKTMTDICASYTPHPLL